MYWLTMCDHLYKSRSFGSSLVWTIQLCVNTIPQSYQDWTCQQTLRSDCVMLRETAENPSATTQKSVRMFRNNPPRPCHELKTTGTPASVSSAKPVYTAAEWDVPTNKETPAPQLTHSNSSEICSCPHGQNKCLLEKCFMVQREKDRTIWPQWQ